jgi:ribonucleoside-diphosphate reductase alpha chain
MGFHAYLQSRMIPFEGLYATIQNHRIFSTIKRQAEEASRRLALTRGEYPDGIGTGLRNAHLLAIAPNSNSAVLMDTSPSIEPWKSNSYTHRTRAGAFRTDNPYLVRLLKTKEGVSVEEVMDSVVLNGGSVQHLSCLTDDEKAVFKTAFEIDQMWLVEHASERQEYICQGPTRTM